MSQPSQIPEPSYTKIQMSGPPEAVARLMAALGGAGEIIFDHRSEPDARGEVACTARVATFAASGPADASGPGEAVVQSTLELDAGRWHGLGEQAGAEELEAAAAAALAGLDGVHRARSRLVAVSARAGLSG
ncbi:hypothetical protein [Streptomyces sp. NPDC007904]|uniref:hypothetical protein n=1 Tax=Streptomyces sp. NPDC007904 TaxID=3364787 RepID=UPI0036EE4E61